MPVILATQEDYGSKPDWTNNSRDPISKIPNTHTHTHTHKRTGGVAQGVRPEFKPQYRKKKQRERVRENRSNSMKTSTIYYLLVCLAHWLVREGVL
jgi:hypothetical protein